MFFETATDNKAEQLNLGNPERNPESKDTNIQINNNNTSKKNQLANLSQDCFLNPQTLPQELMNKINAVDFQSILQPIIEEKKMFYFIKLSIEDILTYQLRELDSPLLKIYDENDKNLSIQMFKNLLCFMNDLKSKKEPQHHVRKFIKNAMLRGGNILKDEAYLQIYKQLNKNYKEDSFIRGWKFLCVVSSCFVPFNENIYYLILNFIYNKRKKEKNFKLITYMNFIFNRMLKTKNNHQRKYVPSVEEIEYILQLKPIPIPIFFSSGNQSIVKVESYTTIKQLKIKIMEMLNIYQNNSIFYSICELCFKENFVSEKIVDDNNIVCDFISSWKDELDNEMRNGDDIDTIYKLYLKPFYNYYKFDNNTNQEIISMHYFQMLTDVIMGKFPLTNDKIIRLATLQILIQYGVNYSNAENILMNDLERFIPVNKIANFSNEEWVDKIINDYNKITELGNNPKLDYINELKEYRIFQAQIFDIKINKHKTKLNLQIPDKCLLGIKEEGIFIMNKEYHEVVFYDFTKIKTIRVIKDQVYIDLEEEQLVFFCAEIKAIKKMIDICLLIRKGKSVEEIENIYENNDGTYNKNKEYVINIREGGNN